MSQSLWTAIDRHRVPVLRRLRATLALAALVAGVSTCSSDRSSAPGPQWRVSLVSPSGAEGAAVIELTAPSHRFATERGVIVSRRMGDRVQLAVFRPDGGTITMTAVSDDGSAPRDPRVLQVVDAFNDRRPSLDGYTVRIEALR